ncbi:MAG: carboxypeptidase regulatory-like domain-containing protein [Alistipes sp.]|nr:carboxypeptidase regulatory-like domain-containing protein [Alistipes sp.]
MKRLLLTVVLSLVVAVAMAQVTTSSVRGIVTANDKPLIGATIVAVHTPSGTHYGTTTNNQGLYTISAMRVGGPYEITISYIGYKSVVYKDITLQLGQPTTINEELHESALEVDDVLVIGSMENNSGNTFNREQMESVPSIDRSIYDLTNILSSAVSPAAGGIILGGQSSRYNAFTIDGTSSADIYGLGTTGMTGSLTEANPIPLDALSAVTISTSSIDIRESGFTGGVIKAVTRSGDNEFKGSAYTYYNNEHFWGTTPGKDVKERTYLSQQTTNILGLTFGGPLVKDKLFFFVAGEFNRSITPSTNHPGTGASALTLDEAKSISERYEALTGYNGGGWSEHNVMALTGSAVARLDWNINSDNHLSVRYNMLYADADDSANSLQSFKFRGAEYTNINRTHSVVAELNSVKEWGSNSLRVGYTRLRDGRTSPESLPAVIINGLGENGNGSATIGTDPYSGCTMLDQDIIIFGDDINITRGKHNITIGTSNEIYRADNLYLSNARGTYTYDSLDNFLNDKASKYQYGYFADGKRNPAMTTGQFAVYAQDEVILSNIGVLTYGLRADLPVMFDTPLVNDAFNESAYATMHNTKTGDIPRTQVLFSPRVGFETQLARGLKLRASTGIYTGRVPFVWLSNCYQNNGLRSLSVTNSTNPPAFSVDSSTEGVQGNPSIDIVDKDFRYPQVFRTTLALEYSHKGLKLGLDADYTKGLNNIYIENLIAEDKGDKLYVGGDGTTTASTYYNATQKPYSAVYRLSNTQKGYSWSTTARLEYDFVGALHGLRFTTAYTYSQSKSVNDGFSAQSSTNWGRTYATESNNPALSNSVYEFPHKVVSSLSYARRYGRYGTNVMLLYNGHSGEHYSLTYYKGGKDVNGDSYKGNSLIYIPTEAEMESMSWADDTSKDSFNNYIKGDKYLRTHRGKFAERNSHSLPFEHRLDLHIAQSFYFDHSSQRRVEFTCDIINLTNLLSRSWGMVHRTSNWTLSPLTVTELQSVEGGYRPVYKFTEANYTTDDVLSRWRMQIGIRVVF